MSTTKFAGIALALLTIFGGAAQVAEAQQGGPRIVMTGKGTLRYGSPRLNNGKRYGVYKIYCRRGFTYRFAMTSSRFDTYMWIQNHYRNGHVDLRKALVSDDDSGSGTNSVCEVRCTGSGYFYIVATSYNSGRTGDFFLAVSERRTR